MRRLTALIALLMLVASIYATTVIVGDDSDDTIIFFPISSFSSYSYTQQLYRRYYINHGGEITKIGFYIGEVFGEDQLLENSQDWTIYMGHVSRHAFASASDWEPIANLTEVFSGNVINFSPTLGDWLEITLDTPFIYNNTDNLVVAVYESTPGYGDAIEWKRHTNYQGHNIGITVSGENVIDPNNIPILSVQRYPVIASIKLVFSDAENLMSPILTSPANNASIMNGEALEWVLPQGSAYASGYDVYIDGALVSENQPATQYIINDLAPGQHSWYVVAKNHLVDSPPSATLNFLIPTVVDIGNGNEDFQVPIWPYSEYNYTQSIFLQSEIGIGNQGNDNAACYIEKIAYYWNGACQGINSHDWVVYMGHTNRTAFSHNSDWVPVNEMVQVFSGQLPIPATPGWVLIPLQTPFLYNTTSNLVIAVDENTPGIDLYENIDPYFHGTYIPDQNRSITYFGENSINPDPNSPPVGTLQSAIPNIRLLVSDLLSGPILSVSPVVLDYELAVNGVPTPLDVTVSNVGIGSLNLSASDFSFFGPNAAEFSIDPATLPVSLSPMESLNIPIVLTGTTPGFISATLRIVYQGQNYDVTLRAEVTPPGTITIGDGSASQIYPFGISSSRESSATLYTADRINAIGTLQSIVWDCAYAYGNEPFNYKIWVKNTHDSYMRYSSWQALVAGMTLVKEGSMFISTPGWQIFNLDTPFVYRGANLIIAVETQSMGYNSENHGFRYTEINERGHLRHSYNNTPSEIGFIDGKMPNVMLNFTQSIANDLCAVDISGPLAPTLGETSNYTVRIRNNGSNTQSNYRVKLMLTHNVEIAVVNGPPIYSGEIVEVVIPWVPSIVGQNSIHGRVEMTGDATDVNNRTKPLRIDIAPANLETITIGAGNTVAPFPMEFSKHGSLYEAIYLADELGFQSGTISSMVIYNEFFDDLPNEPTQIFLGSTYRSNLNTGFIPATQMTLVFDGMIDYPMGENNILINFQTPFVHTGGNLAVMFHRPEETDSYSVYDVFRCQTVGNNRARRVSSHGNNTLDPYSPPEGFLTGKIPQASFFYSNELLANDLGALAISGNPIATLGKTSNYTVRIRNNGTAVQDNYSVKLMGPGNLELANVAGPPINSMQSLDVVLPWTPNTVGQISIYGKVELADDTFSMNNRTAELQIMVYPMGVDDEVTAVLNDAGDAVEISWQHASSAPLRKNNGSKAALNIQVTDTVSEDAIPQLHIGYMVYRFHPDQMLDEATWHIVTPEPTLALSVYDTNWNQLPNGVYRWAVKSVYAGDLFSLPSFSNILETNTAAGTIMGTVKSRFNIPIVGATVSNGVLFTTTNHAGQYSLPVPAGTHTVTASATYYISQTVENVIVNPNLTTTVNFALMSATDNDDPQTPVAATALHGNYPNPFNPETTISYSLKEASPVTIDIYNIKGQHVCTLIDESKETGNHTVLWNGLDKHNCPVCSGVYFYKMRAGRYSSTRKMIMMK